MAKCKLTDKLCIDICNEIKIGTPMRHAAISHGISHDTFYRWYNKGKNAKSGKFKRFYDSVEEAKSAAITLRARRIYKAGESNWQADAWWLERVDSKNFGRKDHHTVQSENINKNINLSDLVDESEVMRFINESGAEETDSK